MKINLKNAVKYFFPNPSLEMVYFEAVANAIDAGANLINIRINLDSIKDTNSFEIVIEDNGEGFTDRNFKKFSELLDPKDTSHKGIGRLVFVNYFNKVEVTSIYENKKRTFVLTGIFDGENKIESVIGSKNKTVLKFTEYLKDKINTYDYVKPDSIKTALLQHFFPLFYRLKVTNQELKIKIELCTNKPNPKLGYSPSTAELISSQIPDMEFTTLDAEGIDLFQKLDLYYSIKEEHNSSSVITALCVDDRTIDVDILSKGGLPKGYEIIFLLYSDLFAGKSNSSRQELDMDDAQLNAIKSLFGKKVASILNEKIPKIQERNKEINNSLSNKFPHLVGYFDDNPVGLLDKNVSLEVAQMKFFKAQKEILESASLSDEEYAKSLEISSRLLTEYILYRNIIIEKLKKIDTKSSEADIHNIIVPRHKTFKKENFIKDVYKNNAWLLDDKYMSYTTILSDKDMDNLIKEIAIDGELIKKDDTRPDIALVFSTDPNTSNGMLDVVIVELKKLGVGLAKREELISQLRQRARKLLNYYPDRIQRIWFYGIVDFDKEFIRSLKEERYINVFSKDNFYYKELEIIPDYDEDLRIPIGVNILSFKAFLDDAQARNATFLNILKEGLKASVK